MPEADRIEVLDAAPPETRPVAWDDGHAHHYGPAQPRSRTEKYRKCVLPGCSKVQVWVARG